MKYNQYYTRATERPLLGGDQTSSVLAYSHYQTSRFTGRRHSYRRCRRCRYRRRQNVAHDSGCLYTARTIVFTVYRILHIAIHSPSFFVFACFSTQYFLVFIIVLVRLQIYIHNEFF